MQIIKWVFEMEDVDQNVQAIKSTTCFICVNLAMGNAASISKILDPVNGVLEHVRMALQSDDTDAEHLNNLLWLIANMVAENAQICKKVIVTTNCLDKLSELTSAKMNSVLHSKIVDNLPWIAMNLLLYREFSPSQKQ